MLDDEGNQFPFNFPRKPYNVQLELVGAIQHAIEQRAVGLLESPTGTGKTLSIICGVLSWIVDNRERATAYAEFADDANSVDSETPQWVASHARERDAKRMQDVVRHRRLLHAQRREAAETVSAARSSTGPTNVKRTKNASLTARAKPRTSASRTLEDSFLIDESNLCAKNVSDNDDDHLSVGFFPQSKDATRELDGNSPALFEKDCDPRLKMLFCTRTHSQVQQFVDELRQTRFGLSSTHSIATHSLASHRDALAASELPLSAVSFGSRKLMCINEDVKNLKDAAAVAEACRELLSGSQTTAASESASAGTKRPRPGANRGCPHKDEMKEQQLRDFALTRISDIEELARIAENFGGCPYFASRSAIASGAVDVVAVPYSSVLHTPTRDALGINVDANTIVVFDEAHNLVGGISEMYSAECTLEGLSLCARALHAYRERYQQRLSPTNLYRVKQVCRLADSLRDMVTEGAGVGVGTRVVSPTALVCDAKIDNINLFDVVTFLAESRLCRKILGFIDAGYSAHPEDSSDDTEPKSGQGLIAAGKTGVTAFQAFVDAMSRSTEDGRVAIYPAGTGGPSPRHRKGLLRYFVLHPSKLFERAVGQARAILLLGGTLSPRESLVSGLLPQMSSRPRKDFECGHVIPTENLKSFSLASGPTGVEFEFTHKTRNRQDFVAELGRMALRLAGASPGGVVFFFASYAYKAKVLELWENSGILTQLRAAKPVFSEVRGESATWLEYSEAVHDDPKRGAFLTAVMGGRLSEGINFSDALGRVIVIVGMPFANGTDIETMEVLKAISDSSQRRAYLENQCFTTVNQTIGRAIRHRADYAAVVLCDRRYSRHHGKLPRFVREGIRSAPSFAFLENSLNSFFKRFACEQPTGTE